MYKLSVCVVLCLYVTTILNFLNVTVTNGRRFPHTYVYGYDVETKDQSSQWKCRTSLKPKKARHARSNVKLILTVSLDRKDVVYHEFLPKCMTEEMQELIEMLHNTCKEQTSADEGLIQKAKNGEFTEDGNLKCYMKCIMSEMATISDEGIVDVDAAIALLPEEVRPKVEPTMRKCGTQVGADPCDNAFLTFKCYHDNNKEEFFMP